MLEKEAHEKWSIVIIILNVKKKKPLGLRGTDPAPVDSRQQKKRDAEEADKVEVAPGVTVASLRRFRTALIGPTQGLPKRRRLCR